MVDEMGSHGHVFRAFLPYDTPNHPIFQFGIETHGDLGAILRKPHFYNRYWHTIL
jgi:hypothetical protein